MAETAAIPEEEAIQNAALIVNTESRHGLRLCQDAVRHLAACGVRLRHTYRLRQPMRVGSAVEDALCQGSRLVIVGGGDGTVNAAVNALAGREVPLGVLPLGTGNDFARTLGIPLDVRAACRVLSEGRVASVDLGRVNGRYFLNTVSIGFTAHAAHSILPGAKRWLGRSAYLLAGVRAFLGYKGFRARVHLDGRTEEFDATEVIAGNGRFHAAGTLLAPDASINNGLLVFYAFEGLSQVQMVKMALLVYSGRHVYHRQSHFAYARSIEIETDPPQPILVDGERRGHTPAFIHNVPGALPVLVPSE